MSEGDSQLREQELAFFGRIAADVSHDMRNVLSVVGEYAGLADDLLAAAKKRKPADPAQLRKLSEKTVQQVQRGTEILGRLSRFAHAADKPVSSVEMNALVGNIAALAQRRVRLANCRMDVQLNGSEISVNTSAFAVQHGVYAAIMHVLGSVAGGESLTLKVEPSIGSAVVSVSGRTEEDPGAADGALGMLQASLSGLGITLAESWESGVLTCRLEVLMT